ncbi:MAG: P1 family peptidase [Gemmatimonadales bacterium]
MSARRPIRLLALLFAILAAGPPAAPAQAQDRPRARDLGVAPGVFAPGPNNAITDVAGVRVGHTTIVAGDSVRTGVTAILPHGGNPYFDRVPAAIVVGNGFGKLLGVTQVRELGELETPILLTCTLCVWKAADAMTGWMLARPGMENVFSINPVVGETNDGFLNDIRNRPITPDQVVAALESAAPGPVAEGAVGAGTGTIAFGWKGGIGSSSRTLPAGIGGWTLGVLVQSNFGGVFQMLGVPIGKALGQYAFQRDTRGDDGDGSIMMVVATDAPITERNLRRVATRALLGLARTGSPMTNGSGDYVIAFATHPAVRRPGPGVARDSSRARVELGNDQMSALFEAAVEATEEAIYNSMLKATTTTGRRGTIEALPVDRVRELLARYRAEGR